MKIAVTGANGFIGRYVVAELQRREVQIVAVVRPGSDVARWLIQHQVVPIDIKQDTKNTFDLMGRPDALIHLAWGGLPNYYSRHHFEEELPAQYRFLRELILSGIKHLVITGTCAEYGLQFGPLREDMATDPSNPYGFAKDALRRQLEWLRKDHPFDLTWARLFYLYGDGQAEGSLLQQLKQAEARGQTNFDMSAGEQLRDYLPVEAIAEYLTVLTLSMQNNGIVNVCSGMPISVRSLVEEWIRRNHWRIKPAFGRLSYHSYEPMAFWGSREKLDRCLQRDPGVSS